MAEQSTLSALERLEIIQACERLTADYAWANDVDREQVGMQFSEDAEMILWGKSIKGRETIRAFLAKRDPATQTLHVATNFRIDVESAHRARGTAYVTALAGQRGADGALPNVTTTIRGVYHDRYVKVGGRWFISERRFEEMFKSEGR